MGSPFDRFQTGVFDTVFKSMATDVVWSPKDGSPTQYAKVLFNEPTGRYDLAEQYGLFESSTDGYEISKPRIEYRPDDLPGLWESVQAAEVERLTINGILYCTLRGVKKYDGKTIIVYLNKI